MANPKGYRWASGYLTKRERAVTDYQRELSETVMAEIEKEKKTPSQWDDEQIEVILQRLASGETLKAICRTEGYPSHQAIRRWAIEDKNGFASRYKDARELGLMAMIEETIDIADEVEIGVTKTSKPSGIEIKEADMTEHRKLKIAARQWLVSRVLAQYGNKVTQEHVGANGGPIQTQTVKDMTDEELAAELTKYGIDQQTEI